MQVPTRNLSPDSIIPRPQSIRLRSGSFRLSSPVKLACDPSLRSACEWLSGYLRSGAGWRVDVVVGRRADRKDSPREASIRFVARAGIEEEGYCLSIGKDGVTILSSTPAGALYGAQSLRQLLPPTFEERLLFEGPNGETGPGGAGSDGEAGSTGGARNAIGEISGSAPRGLPSEASHPSVDLPRLEIADRPRFRWRGAHLDVARHFFSVGEVKRFIDIMALFKLNRFHWHLTDDQGWRIEIAGRPRLTEIGSNRIQLDGTRYGGFYTREEIRDVVDFAFRRGVVVVPEIEMPGHSQAAVASYHELSCGARPGGSVEGVGGRAAGGLSSDSEPGAAETAAGAPRVGPQEAGRGVSVWNRWGISSHPLCPGKEETYRFLEEVLNEVARLFPSREIHIGGDECPTDAWSGCPDCRERMQVEGLLDERELQGFLIARIQRHLAHLGRRLVGWEEILEGDLGKEAVVMSWRGMARGIAAARMGYEVVMTPEEYCYLDHRQSNNPGEPEPTHFHPPAVTLDHLYAFEPVPEELLPEEQPRVIGGQGNLWSEAIDCLERLDYMAFPRLIALAEVFWSDRGRRDFSSFKTRLRAQQERLDRLGVGYCHILESL